MNDQSHADVLRMLDANANRAAEGLRTLEDVARLVREDRGASETLKSLRHQLGQLCQGFERQDRLAARAVETDAGTTLTTDGEATRADWPAVISAAAERVTQSLRTLEECSKFLSAELSQQFKQLRYAAYDQLADCELRLRSPRSTVTAQLYLLVDCSQDIDAFRLTLRKLAEGGVELFQLRDKAADGGRLMQYARAAMDGLRETKSRLIINDRVDIALASGAAGVHIGQTDMELADARRLTHGRLWIGVSTHDLEQAERAQQQGADYIGCGPTFPSPTKQFNAFPGVDFLSAAASRIRLPLFAIGGIDLENLQQVTAAGCQRVAVSSAIQAATDPYQAARLFSKALQAAAAARATAST